MEISDKAWNKYISTLSTLEQTAKDKLLKYLEVYPISTPEQKIKFINYAYGISTKYGEGAAALSAEMYDAIAQLSGMRLDPAEVAEVATYEDVAKAINGTLKTTEAHSSLADSIGRLVKRAGCDTTLKNAHRDHAQFAWVPHGDTCAFCITLASQGWTYTKNWKPGQHAQHIHSNCDCTYAVRFDENSGVKGYDPDHYYQIYKNAEGDSSKEKIRSMSKAYREEHRDEILEKKRIHYAEHRDEIRERERERYAEQKDR